MTLGFCTALYLFSYSQFESSFDNHIPNRENKVRLTIEKYRDGDKITSSTETYVGCGPVLFEKLPEVVRYTRTFNMAIRMNSVISYEPESGTPINLKLKDYYYADSSFLDFFGYQLLQGDNETALSQPGSAVITETLAKVYFGSKNPMGEVLHYQDEDLFDEKYVITGVIKDPPPNTHLPFSLLVSYNTFDTRPYPSNYKDSWKARKAYTYLQLSENADMHLLEEKLAVIMADQKSIKEGSDEILSLQPITETHFSSDLNDEPTTTVSKTVLEFLEIVGLLILVISVINYINLSTTSLLNQTGQVGVRKVLGATKSQLIIQYYIQCTLINLVAMVLALIILYLAWPFLVDLSGTSMPVNILMQSPFILTALSVLAVNILISGIIPSLYLASFNPLKAINGKVKSVKGKSYRFMLIVGQFTISFCLIMAMLIVQKQLGYMQNQKLGFDIEQLLIVRVPGVLPKGDRSTIISNRYEQFMTGSLAHPTISHASASLTVPGHERAFRTGAKVQGQDQASTLRFNGTGPSFLPTFNMELIAGRNFKEGNKYDIDSTIILSASAVKTLGFNSPDAALGQIVIVPAFRITAEVIGVVNDYRLASAKSEIEPTAFLYFLPSFTNFFSFKINGKNPSESVTCIDSIWRSTFPGNPLDYFFLDDFFNQQYMQEKKLSRLFGVFGSLAIVLAAMGLLGLSAYTAQQRTKEIGIRKAMGSTELQIFRLLSSRFILMVIIASFLGAALTYYYADSWLAQFPHQTDIPLWLYIIPMALLIGITILSISYQTIKVATHNPVDSLKHQ